MENKLKARGSLVTHRLPWITGLSALVLYFLTLNHWISFFNMPQVAKLSGYSWQSEVLNPVYVLVSSPLRLLPVGWTPLGVNLLAAVCAALSIGLLTRAVLLLPHDRTHQQRERLTSSLGNLSGTLAWLPPALAAVVLALQLSFWQHATNGTPEMVNLLLLAYVVRALLEHRASGEDAWLSKATLAYGLLMTSDWLAVGLSPAFLGALIWLKGVSFFQSRFLTRILLCGVIGLSLYFLLPVIGIFWQSDPTSFWATLKANLGLQKTMVMMFPKKVFLLMSLTSLVPVLVFSFKWASYFGDTSQLGITLATTVFHVAHAALLGITLWVMFDPAFSPRNSGGGSPFLNLYFFSALSVGYFSGYFLLVFRPILTRAGRTISGNRLLHKLALALIGLLAVIAPVALVIKNLPIVRETNRGALAEYARLTTSALPKSAYLLADDPRRALLVKMWLNKLGREKDHVVVETWALSVPEYNRHLNRQYGERWPFGAANASNPTNQIPFSLDVLKMLAQAGDLYYLHPSFGIFFEHFHLEPRGMLYRLLPFDGTTLLPPPLPASLVAENEAFWKKAADEVFPRLIQTIRPPEPRSKLTLRAWLIKQLRVPDDLHGETRAAGALISRSLNHWAVEVQKTGDLEKSAGYFEQALQLNPDNVAAQANLEFNRKYRSGAREPVVMPSSVEDLFGEKYRSWEQVLGANGPFDEPNLCYAQGFTLMRQGLTRQAAAAFDRVHAFAPDDLPSRLWLAQLNLLARQPDRTLELTREIISQPERFEASATNHVDAISLSARAYFARQEPEQAVALLESAVKRSPTNFYLLANVTGVYSENGRFTNALVNIERQLRLNPNDTASLLNKGFCHIQMNAFSEAIATMTRLLTLETNNANARLNRAIAYLRNDQLDEARADYEALQIQFPTARPIYYGLGEIAYRRKDTNLAIQHYEAYRSNAAPNTEETKFVERRLQELRGNKPESP